MLDELVCKQNYIACIKVSRVLFVATTKLSCLLHVILLPAHTFDKEEVEHEHRLFLCCCNRYLFLLRLVLLGHTYPASNIDVHVRTGQFMEQGDQSKGHTLVAVQQTHRILCMT